MSVSIACLWGAHASALEPAQNCELITFAIVNEGTTIYDRMECDLPSPSTERAVAFARQRNYGSGPACNMLSVYSPFTNTGSCSSPSIKIPGNVIIFCTAPGELYGNRTTWELAAEEDSIYALCGDGCGYNTFKTDQSDLLKVVCNEESML